MSRSIEILSVDRVEVSSLFVDLINGAVGVRFSVKRDLLGLYGSVVEDDTLGLIGDLCRISVVPVDIGDLCHRCTGP